MQIKEWVARNIPDWRDFNVKGSAEFLGMYLGPSAGRDNWIKPIAKLRDRMQVVKKSGASVFLGAFSFNSRIAPVLSYQAQLLPPPKQLMRTERVALHTILRIPNSCFRHVNFFELPKFGGPNLRSPYYACCAALFRTAVKTTPHWQKWMVQLREVQREVMPMAYVPR